MRGILIASLAAAVLLSGGHAQAGRPEDVIAAIAAWNSGLSAGDRQAKYVKMSESPFTFYRGTNHLFWDDFAQDPRLTTFGGAGAETWIQGDMHAANYGSFDNDRGDIVYDVNDFDESVVADYQYDVWRMATSLALISRQQGFSSSTEAAVLDAFTESYLDTIAVLRGNDSEKTLIFTEANTYGPLDNFLEDVEQDLGPSVMLAEWTKLVGGVRKFNFANVKLATVSTTERNAITSAMAAYGATLSGGIKYSSSFFKVKDVAQRLDAGNGSLGSKRYYILIEGATTGQNNDRILDVKQQGRPTPFVFLGSAFQAQYTGWFTDDAHRHQVACKALTMYTDDLLGRMTLSGVKYSVRERSPYKETFDTDADLSSGEMTDMAEEWGTILAVAHCRADKDFDTTYVPDSFDAVVDDATDGYHTQFRSLVRSVAIPYADQVEEDYYYFLLGFGY